MRDHFRGDFLEPGQHARDLSQVSKDSKISMAILWTNSEEPDSSNPRASAKRNGPISSAFSGRRCAPHSLVKAVNSPYGIEAQLSGQ
jgi:hypothetical protein